MHRVPLVGVVTVATKKRTRAQRRWHRKGYTHETGWWSGIGKPWNFLLVLTQERAAYFRKHQGPDDFTRPIAFQFIHNGRKP